MKRLRLALFVVAFSTGLPAAPSSKEFTASLNSEIHPLLEVYCSRCHGAETRTAGIAFSEYRTHQAVLQARSVWTRALRVLRENEMPPAGPQPAIEERLRLIRWIDDAINHLDWSEHRDPGAVTMPRLNRREYNNTIRDLTGLDLQPADAFPPDSPGETGFRNDRDGLFVAPLLVEKYLSAAKHVADALVTARNAKENIHVRLEIEDFLRTETNHEFTPYGLDLRNYQQTVYRYVTFPRFGRYRFVIRAWGASPVPGETPGVTLRVGDRIAGQAHVTAEPTAPGEYVFHANIPMGSQRVSLHWFKSKTAETSDHNRRLAAEATQRQQAAKAAGEKPPPKGPVILSLDRIEIQEDLDPGQDGSLVWTAEPGAELSESDAARRVLENFAERAYRGSVETSEVDRLMDLYRRGAHRGEPFESAVAIGLQAVLSSPRFLYRREQRVAAPEEDALNDFDLASRLSYFLWLSMPDPELMGLAREGRLADTDMLKRQAVRMIADPKSRAFTSAFASEWLGFADLGSSIKPDDVTFPEFTPALGKAMVEEATSSFDRIVREDRSLLEVLDSDFTYLNEELARHYGVEGVVGRDMRLVELHDGRRGGVLGMGAILTATSLPTRTSPVVRGMWVLETMFGEELPPPPPDAGELPESGESPPDLTLRQTLERHRDEARCAVCHNRIDPIGFGLENFDAIGRWRDTDNGQPVDATGRLLSGTTFEGPLELKRILLSRREEFARMVSAQMLRFALGRELEYYDEPTVQSISASVVRSGFSARTLVEEIVSSYPFRYRRDAARESD